MAQLRPEYIVVHTAAYNGRNCDRDLIDHWHGEKGWSGIGYHYVIINDKHDRLEDGELQDGRDTSKAGAHVLGLNDRSIGICCAGHGDKEPFTNNQIGTLKSLVSDLIDQFEDLTVQRIIGHREVNRLVNDGVLGSEYRTTKTCPGNLVEMDRIRQEIWEYRDQERKLPLPPTEPQAVDEDELRKALELLVHLPSDYFPNADEERRRFLFHPEVIAFRAHGADTEIPG